VFDSAADAYGRLSESTLTIEPNEATATVYTNRFAQFQHLYPLLKTDMHRLKQYEG
jgi:hypothetical protein